ncbi:MAG: peroxidase [Gammaproteobacteria bacterium]|nr:peroxidase [Gammaproteobacteria bacterium]
MTTQLDLHDIQGNVLKSYARHGFAYARYVLFGIDDPACGRMFVRNLVPLVTTAAPWARPGMDGEGTPRPRATTNIAFSYHGLKRVGLPEKSLHSFPEDFSMGMRERGEILGDTGSNACEHWDPVWNKSGGRVDIWLSINGQTPDAIEERYAQVRGILAKTNGGVVQLAGHRGDNGKEDLPYQDAGVLRDESGGPVPKEHFGYVDGIINPFFKGTLSDPLYVLGAGKPTRKSPESLGGWEPLETGEFILGHRDESFELPKAPVPRSLSYNGSYLIYRKLHQNVGSFNSYIEDQGKHLPGGAEQVAAKFAGRWRNGAPITAFPTKKKADLFMREIAQAKEELKAAGGWRKAKAELKYVKLLGKLVGFDYDDDLAGSRCPLGAHVRRANPRGALEFGVKGAFDTPGALTNRRRLLRRGLPYGESDRTSGDEGNHGIIFMSIGASIERQFEFVQQQWINYGNDFKLANEKDPLAGNPENAGGKGTGRMIFPARPGSGEAPHFCSGIPRFIETRGGGYFFLPSLAALRMIGKGTVDPT